MSWGGPGQERPQAGERAGEQAQQAEQGGVDEGALTGLGTPGGGRAGGHEAGRGHGARDLVHSRAGCQGWQGRSERREGLGPPPAPRVGPPEEESVI